MPRCGNCRKKFEAKYFLQKNCEEEECVKAERQAQQEKKSNASKPKKAIPKFSKKREIENAKYTVLRIEFLGKKENKICPITKYPATEIHHTYCGKDRAKYYLDTTTWIAVSRDGHNWIHDNPKEAREQGFLK